MMGAESPRFHRGNRGFPAKVSGMFSEAQNVNTIRDGRKGKYCCLRLARDASIRQKTLTK
jgi:hypothetical protein